MIPRVVGIDDIAVYVPRQRILLETLVERRANNDRALLRALERAIRSTGQRAIRFPYWWEDSATMGAQIARELLLRERNTAENGAVDNLKSLRYLGVGTETGLDHAKALASFAEGMLQRSGIEVPETISTFQVQQACAGGTVALTGVAALLAVSNTEPESGLILCSDIARYKVGSAAEITQGAGAVAIMLNTRPRLIEIDISNVGYASRDVDDFFRPLGQSTAQVKGSYSVQCYNNALRTAFENYCRRCGQSPREVLLETDMFAMHNPFRNMAWNALHALVTHYTSFSDTEIVAFMDERGFREAVDPTAEVGNIYSGSAYLSLAFLLKARWRKLREGIVGSRVLICSYGSGNTMSIISGTVAPQAPALLATWDLEQMVNNFEESSFERYQQWVDAPRAAHGDFGTDRADISRDRIPTGYYYLSAIREDGYREYSFKR